MNDKKKSKENKKNKNVLPFSADVKNFHDSLDLYFRHPSLPTLFSMMHAALHANASFVSIESELSRLISIDLDQFYGAHGSKYFIFTEDSLESVAQYRPRQAATVEVARLVWKFLEEIKSDDLWGYENYLVGVQDYVFLHDTEIVDVVSESAPQVVVDRPNKLSSLAYELTKALGQQRNVNKKLADISASLGLPMIPSAVWIADLLPERPELKNGLLDFNGYLQGFYQDKNEQTIEDFGLSRSARELNRENLVSILRICAFVIFLPLFKKNVYPTQGFKLHDFWSERLEYISSRESFGELSDAADYLIAISNLLMIGAKLGINSVGEGVVSQSELQRQFLWDVESEYLDAACLSPLPMEGLVQILISINPYEGDRIDDYSFDHILRASDYGVKGAPTRRQLDNLFENSFRGMDPLLFDIVRARLENPVKGWVIPLRDTEKAGRLYQGFWNDTQILEKISHSFFVADKRVSFSCRFSAELLKYEASQIESLNRDHHPALFSRKFSNVVDFMNFEDEEWLDFCYSLLGAGHSRYASVVLAAYLTSFGVKNFYIPDRTTLLDVVSVSELMVKLSKYGSFSIVQQAILDLFDNFETIPAAYKGSIQDFLPNNISQLVPLKIEKTDRYLHHKNLLLQKGFALDKLSEDSQNLLVKGYTLVQDPDLAKYDLSVDAIRNYCAAVENELKSRIPNIDNDLAEELKYLGVEIDFKPDASGKKRRCVVRGLGGFCRIIDGYSRISSSGKVKLSSLRVLAERADVQDFMVSLRDFTNIRNAVQHADQSGGVAYQLSQVEKLLFNEGSILRVLCDTKTLT
jgi:hypothetical protein